MKKACGADDKVPSPYLKDIRYIRFLSDNNVPGSDCISNYSKYNKCLHVYTNDSQISDYQTFEMLINEMLRNMQICFRFGSYLISNTWVGFCEHRVSVFTLRLLCILCLLSHAFCVVLLCTVGSCPCNRLLKLTVFCFASLISCSKYIFHPLCMSSELFSEGTCHVNFLSS